jgi:hypothetical protein
VSIDADRTEELVRKWHDRFPEHPLEVLPSPYRSLTQPLLDYIHRLRQEDPSAFIHVILGELVMENYWEQALHENSDFVLSLSLRHIEGVAVTSIPFQIKGL